MKSRNSERGAAAVEMAIVLPLLVLILMGIMEFGRVFYVQISLSHAAREGARYAAIHHDDAGYDAAAFTLDASPLLASLAGTEAATVVDDGASCAPGGMATVTVTASLNSMTGFADFTPFFPLQLQGEGAMRCGG
ncbi:TadE/TadG family type IV pilus assembly protein [Arthrobacter sulfonylureivorans]|uniref:TadE/TadG family type IV pilus assembly protein n=1 Tax=Arthrobacter sulfonylureivorans TaxID=2486855 RepID=UPI0039E3E5F7